jgi:hypothetical protein
MNLNKKSGLDLKTNPSTKSAPKLLSDHREFIQLKLPPIDNLNKSFCIVFRKSPNPKNLNKNHSESIPEYTKWTEYLASQPLKSLVRSKVKFRKLKRLAVNPRCYIDEIDSSENQKVYENRLIQAIDRIME